VTDDIQQQIKHIGIKQKTFKLWLSYLQLSFACIFFVNLFILSYPGYMHMGKLSCRKEARLTSTVIMDIHRNKETSQKAEMEFRLRKMTYMVIL